MTPKFRVLVLHENGGHHVAFSKRARRWLAELAEENYLAIEYRQSTDALDDAYLSPFELVLQLDYPPYGWKPEAASAFERYIENGTGGWMGFHHASLLGEFDGAPMWDWFSNFLGGIRYDNYIATFVRATVVVEEATHPVMAGVPASFVVDQEEWYTYNRSPRGNVQVLATVDESTYDPASPITMGDHPVVWTNPSVAARNLYIFMGHSPDLFDNESYTTLVRNGILWAAAKTPDSGTAR